MRTYNLFTRFFVAVVFTTITSLAVAGFSAKKAYEADPELLAKLENKYNVQINVTGMGVSVTDTNSRAKTQDQWELSIPAKKLIIKSYSGDIAIRSSNDNKIRVMASGKLDTAKSEKLLEITESADVVTLNEPENAVKDLEVRIELPSTFTHDLEILSVSGDVTAENLKISLADVKTVSGEITLNQLNVTKLSIETVSGDVETHESSFKTINGKSVSGEIEIENKDAAEMNLKSVSGDVKLKLPKAAPFSFNLNTLSGDIKNLRSNITDSSKAAKLNINISTTSGDIVIE